MRNLIMIAAALVLTPAQSALSSYSANISSTVRWVKIYNNDNIIFRLEDHPSTPCTNSYFVISGQTTTEQRNRYYATLLAAKVSGEPVTVGYGVAVEDCYNGSVLVHALEL